MKEYQLEYLLAVVEMKNFTYAAKYLNITQPTLSKAISTLEEEIGFRLFIRSRGGIVLTDEGVKFVAQAKNVVREMRELSNCITRIKSKESEITIGISPILGSILIPQIEKELTRQLSKISIHWIEDSSYRLEERLSSDSIDFAILLEENVNSEKFKVTSLCKMEQVLCLPADHHLASKKSVSANGLSNQEFVILQECGAQGFEFKKLDIHPVKRSYTSQISTAMELVGSGKGMMLIYKPIYEKYKDTCNIKAVSLSPKSEQTIVLACRQSSEVSDTSRQEIVKTIKDAVKA